MEYINDIGLFFPMISIKVVLGKKNNILGSQNNKNYHLAPHHYINLAEQ